MSDITLHLHYDQPPGFAGIYRRLLLGRRNRYAPGTALPVFQGDWKGARADADRIARYCAACGLEDDGHYPLLYPHVLTSAIHIDFISQRQFPLSPMGAVHTRIHVVQHRPIPSGATVDIQCRLAEYRVLKAGIEFDITTTLTLDGQRCWESLSANLIRGKKFGEAVEPPPLAQLPDLEATNGDQGWEVPKDMGWRYAKITGDYNPIHISRIMAKFLGFDRDIIHGMWSGARCLAHVPRLDPAQPVRADLIFKGPVFMESSVTFKSGERDGGHAFDLYCGDNPRPVIRGQLRPAGADAPLVPSTEA